eukprot:TRINITY_DN55362_c0_g1_i1.p2 TRINITY_DN55362_c0_g1~~TRINITY_DN55362_c0_g1_i1.p2  ORF type:complete len:209 (-),score=41.33 TRINITY_DN55362_c0_g1_i1:32-658(-)
MAGLMKKIAKFSLLYQDSGSEEEKTLAPLAFDYYDKLLQHFGPGSTSCGATKRTMSIQEYAKESLQDAGVFIYIGHGKHEHGSLFPRIDPTMMNTSYNGQNVPVEDLMKEAAPGSLLIIYSCNANTVADLQSPTQGKRTFTSSAVVFRPAGGAAAVSKEAPLLDKFVELMQEGENKFDAIEKAIQFLKATPVYAKEPEHQFAIHYFEN